MDQARQPTGVTWFETTSEGVTWGPRLARAFFVTVATTLTVAVLMVAAATPAMAKPPAAGGGLSASCRALLGDAESTTLSLVREAIGLDGQSDQVLGGAGIGVAVIDTGANAVPGLDGRRKVVDGPDLSFHALTESLRSRDLHGHGTTMASIIASTGSISGPGVAPQATVVNVKVGAGDGTVDVSQVIAAIDWVVQNRNEQGTNIRVINLAYSTDSTQDYQLDPLAHAVENAWKAGIVVVVAGGNDGRGVRQLGNPALNPYVIAVGAAEQGQSGTWKVPSWSSTGDGIRNPDLVAPGTSIVAAGVSGSYLASTYPSAICDNGGGASYLRGSGTSQAAAVVSGAAALLLEQRPSLTPDQVKYLLTSTAVDLNAHPTQQGHGMIDLAAAITAPTPGGEAVQFHAPSTGSGSLELSRGSFHVGTAGDLLEGEFTAFGGDWTPSAWAPASDNAQAWTDQTYASRGSWSGGTWSGATWSGATWSGATWSGATWSGATWSGATWSGATWSGATWSGATWSGATWSGATWSGATWSGNDWT